MATQLEKIISDFEDVKELIEAAISACDPTPEPLTTSVPSLHEALGLCDDADHRLVSLKVHIKALIRGNGHA